MPELVLRTFIVAAPDACFGMSLSVDAHAASMSTSSEQAVAGVTSGEMSLGQSVTWRATHFGVPFHMTSTITEHDRPHRFVDEQTRGPFKHWWHEHRFVAGDGGTHMSDRVRFSSPVGRLGGVVDRLVKLAPDVTAATPTPTPSDSTSEAPGSSQMVCAMLPSH